MSRPTITVGVDGSPGSDAALLYALDEAVARQRVLRRVTEGSVSVRCVRNG